MDSELQQLNLIKGVMQGAPLSPAISNMLTNFILDELLENPVAEKYGYQLVSGLPKLTLLGFAVTSLSLQISRKMH